METDMLEKNKIDWVNLPAADDSLSFFKTIKVESEKLWEHTVPEPNIYGYQIQTGTKWKPGLNDSEIEDFESSLNIRFPLPLRNFYKTMNGTTLTGIDVGGIDSGDPPDFAPMFYSFPDDVKAIKDWISFIYKENSIAAEQVVKNGISRIFPLFAHRFMLVDVPPNPILSMWGNDIIYYADNLGKLLVKDIFNNVHNAWDFESDYLTPKPEIKFWLD